MMEFLNKKLSILKYNLNSGNPITIMIFGLGSVGCYLLDYLISLADPQLRIVVVGRNAEKMQMDVNIIRTASTIRRQCKSEIKIIGNCDLNNIENIALTINSEQPDFIINTSRAYSGLKYGSISWSNLRAYGIWTPLSIRYAKNIMEAYAITGCNAITINTSYSDAVIPWLKSAGKDYFDFGSGNLNHLIPRIKFYIAKKFSIDNLNDIDVTIVASHFHDVVISKEGHDQGRDILLDIKYKGDSLIFDKKELIKSCAISMPVDQKRNMMNASSNFEIIYGLIKSIRNKEILKLHIPGLDGMIGGYPYIIDATKDEISSYIDKTFSLELMERTNRKSIYLDGIKDIKDGYLFYTDELMDNVNNIFNIKLPNKIHLSESLQISDYLIRNIILPNIRC